MSLQSPPAAAELSPGPGEGHPPGAELSQGSAAAPSAEEGGEEEEGEEEGEKEKEKDKEKEKEKEKGNEKEREKLPPIPSASTAAAGVGPVSARAAARGPAGATPRSFAVFAALFGRRRGRGEASSSFSFMFLSVERLSFKFLKNNKCICKQ